MSDYSQTVEEGYVWVNEGDGANALLSDIKGVNSLFSLRKYYSNGKFICAWQADSARLSDPDFRLIDLKKNTYHSTDRFYIIDVSQKELYGPYQKDEFFTKAKSLNIHVSWGPVTL
ncbi:hypothetical protein GCM10028805_00760 [Spirosoma harenae]